jgi:hypothetical protein
MANSIRELALHDRSRDPAEAEIWVSVVPERITSSTEVRGRLMGPRCVYSSTVEVAYPLKPFARPLEGWPGIVRRVVIPEASLWDPLCPFLYEGPVELWEDGQLCERVEVRHGLRGLSLGPRGLRVNAQVVEIRGLTSRMCAAAEARQLNDAGFNTLLTGIGRETEELLDVADRFGFLVLVHVGGPNGVPLTERTGKLLERHPSAMGWLVPQGWGEGQLAALHERAKHLLLGMELPGVPTTPLPPQVSFIVCDRRSLPALANLALPKIVLADESDVGDADGDVPAAAGVLGCIFSR